MTLWWIYFRNKNVDILFITHDAVLWQPPSAISNNLFQNCSLVSEKKMPKNGLVIATKFLRYPYLKWLWIILIFYVEFCLSSIPDMTFTGLDYE